MRAPSLKKLPESVKSQPIQMEEGMDNRPTFEVTEDMIPQITEWKVGEKYMLMVEVEQTSVKVKEYGPDKGKVCANFKITKIGAHDENAEMEEYAEGGTVSSEKAKEILRDGTIRNKKISQKQKRYFGWIAGGKQSRKGFAMGGTVLNANTGEKMHNAMSGVPFEKMNKWEEAERKEVKGTELIGEFRPTKKVTDDQVYGPSDRRPGFKEGGEVSYSAKKVAAGQDIGKPGKNFEKIAESAGKKYGSEEAGKKVAGAVLAKLRGKNKGGKVNNALDGVSIQYKK